jgi:hypothetical protein
MASNALKYLAERNAGLQLAGDYLMGVEKQQVLPLLILARVD